MKTIRSQRSRTKRIKMEKEKIDKLNKDFQAKYNSDEQGIYVQPFGIPDSIKEPVIYMRWSPGGVSGGTCWDSSNPQPYYNNESKPKFEILDFVLTELNPNISFLKYKELEKLIVSSSDTEYEYYGNRTDWQFDFLKISDLEKFI